jgi:hypothetical protein
VKIIGIWSSTLQPSSGEKGECEMDVKKINELFSRELVVVNMGLDAFADHLQQERVKFVRMDWRPPAGGDRRLLSLLEKLER